jgi:Arc/MetJ-type ribon-helix-helix transcriptional regulator
MKISISLPDDDVHFLDEYAEVQGYRSRSAVVLAAVRILRSTKLGDAYADAWAQWEISDEADVWDRTASDGLT